MEYLSVPEVVRQSKPLIKDQVITELSPEQEEFLEQWKAWWYANAYSSDIKADHQTVEEGVRGIYKHINRSPKKIYWVDSPHAAFDLINLMGALDDFPQDEDIPILLKEHLDKNGVSPYVASSFSGPADIFWLGHFVFYQDTMGDEIFTEEGLSFLDSWRKYAMTGMWLWIYDEFAVLCERPTAVRTNDKGELHSMDLPAMEFPDGKHIYAINDVNMPRWAYEREITIEDIEREGNVEVKRCLVEKFGIGSFLQQTGMKIIDQELVPIMRGQPPTIPRALARSKDGQMYLIGCDGSSREVVSGVSQSRVYYMQVPPNVRTCREAHQAINGGLDESRLLGQS